MKFSVVLSIFLMINTGIFAQNITVTAKNPDFVSAGEQKEFYYIPKGLDVSVGTQVANVSLQIQRGGNANALNSTFYELWKQANAMGANAFFVSKSDYSKEKNQYNVIVELWFLKDDEINTDLDLYPENLIVVFGNFNTNNVNKGKDFRIAGEKTTVLPYQYITYQNTVGKKVTINVGGAIMGTTATYIGEEGKLPIFLSLGGGSVSPVDQGRQLGITISTGSIYPLDMNFGMFLMDVLSD